jgi:hypothetical protein
VAHPLLTNLGAALAKLPDDRESGQQALTELWDSLLPADHAGRCIVAHYVADACDAIEDEIAWDETALAESLLTNDDDLAAVHPTLHRAGFMSSLHLNLADGYRRLGRFQDAEEQLAASRRFNDALSGAKSEQVAYREMIVAGQDRVAGKIAAADCASPSFSKSTGA